MAGFAVFLILVLIVLVIIFNSTQNTKFTQLHTHINQLQQQLNEALKQRTVVVQKSEEVDPELEKQKQEAERLRLAELEKQKAEQKRREEEEQKRKQEEELKQKEQVIVPVIEKTSEPEEVNIPVIETPKVTKPPVKEPQLSWWDKFKQQNPDMEKFIGENLLSKIAITILVLGIAFFVKYAIDQNWINETARVGIGILSGGIVMGFAHRLRKNFKAFSSVLVAGAIAIFYFTIAIGFHQYHLFSQTVGFVIMTVITAFSVLVSVAYNRVELAALAITGGFAVPFMLSTGQGNYKVLFTYILILDVGMLVLAYLKKWNLINILAYAFTVILYSAWLLTKVIDSPLPTYKGAFAFGTIFYLVFVLMNVVNNIKERRQFSYVELIILISNTFIFYGAGMLVLKDWMPHYKGIYTVAMGSVNFILGIALYKFFKADKRLVYLLIGLTLTFATLAAPVQLKGNYITLFWGAEVALLIWLSQRSQIRSFKLASIIVAVLMFFSLVMDFVQIYGAWSYDENPLSPCLNKGFITGIASALFLFIGAFFLSKEEEDLEAKIKIDPKVYGNILKIGAIFFTYITGFLEVHYQSDRTIVSSNSIVSISACYHVVFTTLLSIILLKRYSTSNSILAFVLLCINFLYYSVVFSIAPYHEMIERCENDSAGYIGYVVHFFAFVALLAHLVFVVTTAIKHDNFVVKAKSVLLWIFGAFTLLVLSNEVILDTLMLKLHDFRREDYFLVQDVYDHLHVQVIKTALPILWGIIAFVFLSIGIRKQLKQLRIMSLVLLAITLLKLFIYDIKDVSPAGKIIAFIILGVVLLIMSFMYQKIKAIILSEEAETTEKNNTENITGNEENPS